MHYMIRRSRQVFRFILMNNYEFVTNSFLNVKNALSKPTTLLYRSQKTRPVARASQFLRMAQKPCRIIMIDGFHLFLAENFW